MNTHLLNTEIQDFINSNLENDATSILLKKFKFDKVSLAEIAEQIEAKQRCKKKLPTWFSTPDIYYPNKINIEQSSSEITAQYKSNLISGRSILDLTAGFGIDSYYFSRSFEHVVHSEIDSGLCDIVKHNCSQLKIENIKIHNGDGIDFLKSTKEQFDWIFIDPSRRHERKGKVIYLNDCLPNVPEHLNQIFEHTENIMIKTSPMLDITQGIRELIYVKFVHIIAINNDVKELLFLLEKGFEGHLSIHTINMTKTKVQDFSFDQNEEFHAVSKYGEVQKYLYEPNAALLKSGAFKLISQKLNLNKLHIHSHLYTSSELIPYPGRVFLVKKLLPYNKKILKKEINNARCNVTIRNFPLTVAQLRKKFKLKDGGDEYFFFTLNHVDEKIVIIAEKI